MSDEELVQGIYWEMESGKVSGAVRLLSQSSAVATALKERDEAKGKCKDTARDFELAFRLVRQENDKLTAERDAALAKLGEAMELLTRAVKWIDRINERRDSIPHFFDNYTDPAPLAKDIRNYLGASEVPSSLSVTPRTDEFFRTYKPDGKGDQKAPGDYARELERELATALAQNEKLADEIKKLRAGLVRARGYVMSVQCHCHDAAKQSCERCCELEAINDLLT